MNSPEGRTNNIILACEKINGTILESGEIFSFNKTVGKRTSESGYKYAPIFVGNQVVNGIGGGICQISSTLYNVGLQCGMKIIERHPHSLLCIWPLCHDGFHRGGLIKGTTLQQMPYVFHIYFIIS